ncbi:MAG: efflux RND transporter periplasmic adaptor subunit [Deltaproteobacteria bacterium]|nr:efflux RND transporter periplasmic adaptor subunit [Deltaproteobacteria bacterium]
MEVVESRTVEYTIRAVGSVEAFEKVQVTSRVSGVVDRVRFAEGDRVQPNEVLAEIEPERFRLAVRSASATLSRAESMKSDAEMALERREEAVRTSPGLIPSEELQSFRTRVRTLEAERAQARASLEEAELNLRDALVRAPAAGVIETRTVQTGQFVQVGALLATLVRRDPLIVRFSVPEPDSSRVLPNAGVRFRTREDATEYGASVRHVGQAADPVSRMVPITAYVDESTRDRLRPGAFAEITVPVGSTQGAAVIPETAVRPSERGFLAFVVEGTVAKERVVRLGLRTDDGKIEVRDGIAVGEKVVVRGGEALRDGAEVILSGEKQESSKSPGAGQRPGGAP